MCRSQHDVHGIGSLLQDPRHRIDHDFNALAGRQKAEGQYDRSAGEAKGRLEVAAQALRSIQLLETVAEHTAEAFAWPAPFTLEMQTCGFPNARWALATHKLTLCYELAADFAELYTTYGTAETRRAVPPPRKRKSK